MHEKDREEISDIEVSREEGADVTGGADPVPPGATQEKPTMTSDPTGSLIPPPTATPTPKKK